MVYVLDKNGQPLSTTTRHGKVRRLLKEQKARVVKDCPFTVQLLYDNVEEDNLMENVEQKSDDIKKTTIIVTDDERWPENFSKEDCIKMSYAEFTDKASSSDGIDVDDIWFDVKNMDKFLYDVLLEEDIKANYFKYNDMSFIRQPIKVINAEHIKNVTPNLIVKFSPDNQKKSSIKKTKDYGWTDKSILIAGDNSDSKTKVAVNIGLQLKDKNVDVRYCAPIFVDANELTMHSYDSASSLNNVLEAYKREIEIRVKHMELEHVNSYLKLYDVPKSKCIIIDSIDYYLNRNDEESINSIKEILNMISRKDKNVGVLLIFTCDDPTKLSSSFRNTIQNVIIAGDSSEDLTKLLLETDFEFNLSDDTALLARYGKEFNIFNINDIKSF